MTSSPADPVRRRRVSRRAWGEYLIFLALVVPNLILIGAFTYRPLLQNIYYSTLHWTLGSDTANPIGIGNYLEFFDPSRDNARTVLGATFGFTVVGVAGSMVLGLLIALALNQRVRGRTFARASVFAPYVLSGVGVGLVWLFIFDPSFGVIAAVLRAFGAQSPRWFTEGPLSLLMVTIVYIWKNVGYCAVVYLAGLQSLPKDIMEASTIDGAGAWSRFRHVVLPLLSPTTFFLLITTILSSLQSFDIIKIMTPNSDGTRTLIYESYLQAFGAYNRAGYSAAVSVILFVILLTLTIIQIVFVEKKVHYA